MKNFKLLLATTAILSTGAMAVKSASNDTTLYMYASFMEPLVATLENYLGFGVILADEGGKTVIINPTTGFDTASSATMMYKGTHTNIQENQSGHQMFF